jgi:hypothetical protein
MSTLSSLLTTQLSAVEVLFDFESTETLRRWKLDVVVVVTFFEFGENSKKMFSIKLFINNQFLDFKMTPLRPNRKALLKGKAQYN